MKLHNIYCSIKNDFVTILNYLKAYLHTFMNILSMAVGFRMKFVGQCLLATVNKHEHEP